jgi:predicted nucleic acid-binding protein
MNGSNLLLDNNIIYALKGLAEVRPYFDTTPFISTITEIEILGVKDLKPNEIKLRKEAIDFCNKIPLSNRIKEKAIEIKQQIKMPAPDAIIAATVIEEGLTLVTADKGFKRIKNLTLILIEV